MSGKHLLYLLSVFFLVVTSLWLHEGIHYLQFQASNHRVDEVCLTGWGSGALGWVKTTSSQEPDISRMEFQSYLLQFIYVAMAGILLGMIIEKREGEN